MNKSKIFLIISSFLALCVFSSNATNYDKEFVQQFAKSFVEQNIEHPSQAQIEVSVVKLDPRINIKPCNTDLRANIPDNHNGRNVNVKIYCQTPQPWQIYLPVKIRTVVPVLIAQSTIAKGSILDSSNMMIELKDTNKIRGEIISDISSVIGVKTKRNISQGSIITKRNVCFVCKGDNVVIIAKSDDFMIKTAGTAMEDGSIGDHISVKNKQSGRIVTAKVNAINTVLINL